MVDASFGFEMEIFEFLNICQVHGFPKIMGVLTHLDHFRDNKQLKKTKKRLKHRFWTEVYQVSLTKLVILNMYCARKFYVKIKFYLAVLCVQVMIYEQVASIILH